MDSEVRSPTKKYNWSEIKMTEEQKKMAEENVKLVPFVVWNRFRKHIDDGDIRVVYNTSDVADIVGAGYVGLCKGCVTFDKTKGYELSTYLAVCITREIIREMRMNNFQKRNIEPYSFLSLDYDYNQSNGEDDVFTLIETLEGRDVIEETESFNDTLTEIMNIIDEVFAREEKKKQVKEWILLLYEGFKMTEISKLYGFTKAEVSRCIRIVKKEFDNRR